MLTDKFKEYLDQAEVVKTLNSDLKDATKGHHLNPDIEKAQKQLRDLKNKLDGVTEIAFIKEKRDAAKERLDLLKEILLAEMNQEGKTEITYEGKKAKIVAAMKFERDK